MSEILALQADFVRDIHSRRQVRRMVHISEILKTDRSMLRRGYGEQLKSALSGTFTGRVVNGYYDDSIQGLISDCRTYTIHDVSILDMVEPANAPKIRKYMRDTNMSNDKQSDIEHIMYVLGGLFVEVIEFY